MIRMTTPLKIDQIKPHGIYRRWNYDTHKWEIIKAENFENFIIIYFERVNVLPLDRQSVWDFMGKEEVLKKDIHFYTDDKKTKKLEFSDLKSGNIYYAEFNAKNTGTKYNGTVYYAEFEAKNTGTKYNGTVKISNIAVFPVLNYRVRTGLDKWSEIETLDFARYSGVFELKSANNFVEESKIPEMDYKLPPLKNQYSPDEIYDITTNLKWRRVKHAVTAKAAAEARYDGGKRKRKTRKARKSRRSMKS
jgi:hypothetical protein